MDRLKGWLVNEERRERRDQPRTLTDKQVIELIHKIDDIQKYTKLDLEFDRLMRMRDKALIALAWIFFRRASENLRVKIGDVFFDDRELLVTFRIRKRIRRVKICPNCGNRNALKAVFCKKCGWTIKDVELAEKGGREVITVTKRKTRKYPFCAFVIEWVNELKKSGCQPDDCLFPPYNYMVRNFVFKKNLEKPSFTVQRFDQILQRLDHTLTSHMFRYGHTEKLFALGYSPYDVKEIGDWLNIHMPEVYAKRKGFTKSQRRFAEDTRMYE